MINFPEPKTNLLSKIFENTEQGLICTPFYSERGLHLLGDFWKKAYEIEFWTRFNPVDWRNGIADMNALRRIAEEITNRKGKFSLMVSDDLHGKFYKAGDNDILIGSANLTYKAFTGKGEVLCLVTDKDASSFNNVIKRIRETLLPIETRNFFAYVDTVIDAILGSKLPEPEEDENFNAAIELAEEHLREQLKKFAPSAIPIKISELSYFIDFCKDIGGEIAMMVVERYNGLHNLQGHIKHCYYGTARFLFEHPEIVNDIGSKKPMELLEIPKENWAKKWRDFLQLHANEIDENYDFSFRTLRIYLPPSLGGVCVGGGGGGGTLKRVFPLVAYMMNKNKLGK